MVDLEGVAAAQRQRDGPRVEDSCVWLEDIRFVPEVRVGSLQ